MTVDTLLMIVLGTSIFLLLASFAVQIGFGLYFRSAYIVWLWQTATYYVTTLIARLPVDLAKRRLRRGHAQIRPVSVSNSAPIQAVSAAHPPAAATPDPAVALRAVVDAIHAATPEDVMIALVTKRNTDKSYVWSTAALARLRAPGGYDCNYEKNTATIETQRALLDQQVVPGRTLRIDDRIVIR